MGTIRAECTPHAVVAPAEVLRVATEGAVLARATAHAFDATAVVFRGAQTAEELAVALLERTGVELVVAADRAHERSARRTFAARSRVAASSACSSRRRRR